MEEKRVFVPFKLDHLKLTISIAALSAVNSDLPSRGRFSLKYATASKPCNAKPLTSLLTVTVVLSNVPTDSKQTASGGGKRDYSDYCETEMMCFIIYFLLKNFLSHKSVALINAD